MDNSIKKKSLIPRMFRAFTVYFFITLAVFFGYIEMFGGVKTIRGSFPDSAQGEVDMSFSNFVSNMMSLHNIYADGVELKFEGGGTSISLNADIAVDLVTSNASISAKLDVDGHIYNVGVVYCEPEVFLSIDERTYRFETASVGGDLDFSKILGVLSEVSKSLNVDFGGLQKIQDAIGIDFSNLSMASLMEQLNISTKKANGEVKISIIVMNLIEAVITCDENCFMKSATVEGRNIGSNTLHINVPTVEMNSLTISDKIKTPDEENIIDLSPINDYVGYAQNLFANDYVEIDASIDVSGKRYDAKINLDNVDGTKLKVSTEVEGYKVAVVYADETIYLNVDDFGVSISVNDLMAWKDRVVEIVEERTSKSVSEVLNELFDKYIDTEGSQDFAKKIQDYLNNLVSCSENFSAVLPSAAVLSENQFVLTWGDSLVAELSNESGVLSSLNVECKDVVANVDFKVSSVGVDVPTNCEDLSAVLTKLDNLLSYVEAGIFEFDFNANYNGLEFAGKFKYANGVFEISDVLAAGEIAKIRIENGFVYFSYGNMKLKFVVPENNGTVESANVREMISKVMSDTFGVEIKFGVFEELLDMIANYSEEDWKTKLVFALTGNQDDFTLTVSNRTEAAISKILTANVTFSEDKIDTAKVSLYDILSAQIKVNYVEQSTIKPFDEEEYKDYSENFMAGALDSLEVVPNVYGFSSDVAIRYSKTTFYGEIVAMMVKDETNPVAIGGYVPAVSIHTTSLGLNSYIYVVGQTLYVDINGLQISADLSKATIDEVLAFVESKFGVALAGEGNALMQTAEAFRVILPAIDKIYGSWISETENGIQIRIEDGLWYGAQSRFEDIVLQAFISNYNNIIVPTKVVIGANIYDPNTLVYDDYSDAWLDAGVDENGNKIVIEDAVTQNLNFGAYFTNLSVGVFAESIDRVFAIEDRNYQNITSVVSNYGVTNLSDFNSYKTVLTLAETIYDYGVSMQYQISLDGAMVDENSQMGFGGDVVVSVADLAEGQTPTLELFGGKSLKVQGNLDLNMNGVQHLVDLIYSNVDEGLFLTYTHGDNIAKGNKFKAKIANANMSEIISMLVKFANLDLGDSMKEAWNIDYCTTDFSYIQSLLGIGKTEVGDPVSKADVALNSVENITKMLGLIKLDKTVGEDGLSTITLSVELKLNENASPALVSLVLKEEVVGDAVVTRLRQISIQDLVFGGKTIDLTIDVQDFSEASFDYDTSAEHIDLSDMSKLIDTFVTTANTKNFTFNGDVSVNLGGVVKIDMELDLFISLEDITNPYIFAQLIINPNSIADMVFNGSFDKRLVTYEFTDGYLTFHRYSKKQETKGGFLGIGGTKWDKVTEDSVSKNTYHSSELVSNLTTIILDSMGMKETFLGINIPNMIINIIKNINVNPTLEEALIGFTTDSDCVNTTIKLNGANLLGDGAENIDLNFGATKYNGFTYDDKGNVVDKTYSCIDSITGLKVKMTGVDIALNLYSKNDADSYQTTAYTLRSSYEDNGGAVCGGRLLYTNRYYRTQYINTVGGLYA